jgi:NAD(P)H-dependent FMN reductase
MQGIVCIAGTNRPENYTVRALGIVVDAFRQSRVDPVVFDARTLSLAFPGHPDPGDGERLRTAIAAAPGVILATPEYHGSFCAMTKLIIENLGFPSVLAGKPVALVGVAPAVLGPSSPLNN